MVSCPLSLKGWVAKPPSDEHLASSMGQRSFSLDPLTYGRDMRPTDSTQFSLRSLPFTVQGLSCPDDKLQGWNTLGKSLLRLLLENPTLKEQSRPQIWEEQTWALLTEVQKSQEKVAGYFLCCPGLYSCWSRVSHRILTVGSGQRKVTWLSMLSPRNFFVWLSVIFTSLKKNYKSSLLCLWFPSVARTEL